MEHIYEKTAHTYAVLYDSHSSEQKDSKSYSPFSIKKTETENDIEFLLYFGLISLLFLCSSNPTTLLLPHLNHSSLSGLVKTNLSFTVQRVQSAGYDITARSSHMLLIDLLFETYLKKAGENR
ncbi:hypothetical protein QUF84_27170 [Fictibacillus enclensis]|uniref:hypothetical protein n=1 Tax=Fictibacillus enclensis TaxID=1017270 RepID=UPI0025A239E6|nr:hypothetical protein [Fictibacillus enclensis]MDM5340878.1 hypothetical protein [Fictibacillus enclensis]